MVLLKKRRGDTATMRWARRKLLKIDLVHNLPKAVHRQFLDALLDAYAHGYEAAVRETQSAS